MMKQAPSGGDWGVEKARQEAAPEEKRGGEWAGGGGPGPRVKEGDLGILRDGNVVLASVGTPCLRLSVLLVCCLL
jgi:hypothetical protein